MKKILLETHFTLDYDTDFYKLELLAKKFNIKFFYFNNYLTNNKIKKEIVTKQHTYIDEHEIQNFIQNNNFKSELNKTFNIIREKHEISTKKQIDIAALYFEIHLNLKEYNLNQLQLLSNDLINKDENQISFVSETVNVLNNTPIKTFLTLRAKTFDGILELKNKLLTNINANCEIEKIIYDDNFIHDEEFSVV